MSFPPLTWSEVQARRWDGCDIILVSGDAYVDHPSFGIAIIARVLEAEGFRVGIIAQPDWRSREGFMTLGRPRLCFGVSSGNIDSMLHHYTANRKLRRDDPYAPGGKHGLRPNRAVIVYCNRLRQAFPGVPLVIGGIEASLRRLAHYDYWDDAVRRSILFDSRADILVHGMGERPMVEIARRLAEGERIGEIREVPGTAVSISGREWEEKKASAEFRELPSYDEVSRDRTAFALAQRLYDVECRPGGRRVVQRHGDRYLMVNPPAEPLTTAEMDRIYGLPFTRRPHPLYREPVPALETVKWSIVSHRGCYGGCSFCTLYYHQGPAIQSRSLNSIVAEAKRLAADPGFKGTITDIGGPTANMYGTGCRQPGKRRNCLRPSCLYPTPCRLLDVDQSASLRVWRAVLKIPEVKRIYVASGVRHDLALRDERYLAQLVREHTGGHLKVAPEHCVAGVLRLMRKPGVEVFLKFLSRFRALSDRKQYLVPYLISSHPGTTYDDMLELRDFLRKHRLRVEQVQDFIPLPLTDSAAMYYTGQEPRSGEPVFVEKTVRGKLRQRYSIVNQGGELWEGS